MKYFNFKEFLQFNQTCPICSEPLNLYLQIQNSTCFKADNFEGKIAFNPSMNISNKLKNSQILIENNKLSFNDSILTQTFQANSMYFFVLCSENGIKKSKNYGVNPDIAEDYEINIYKSCYWRSSPILELQGSLTSVNPDQRNLINGDEVFSFKEDKENKKNVYTLQINYSDNETRFYYYAITPEEENIETFEPKIFEKTMPLISVRPDFTPEHREKLMDRFGAWLIMS